MYVGMVGERCEQRKKKIGSSNCVLLHTVLGKNIFIVRSILSQVMGISYDRCSINESS